MVCQLLPEVERDKLVEGGGTKGSEEEEEEVGSVAVTSESSTRSLPG